MPVPLLHRALPTKSPTLCSQPAVNRPQRQHMQQAHARQSPTSAHGSIQDFPAAPFRTCETWTRPYFRKPSSRTKAPKGRSDCTVAAWMELSSGGSSLSGMPPPPPPRPPPRGPETRMARHSPWSRAWFFKGFVDRGRASRACSAHLLNPWHAAQQGLLANSSDAAP
jgi:hypothetical protein